jgi:hypothetical protein
MSKSSARDGRWNKPVFEQQADAPLSQDNPVANTLYTVLNTTNNVKIESITVQVTWTVQPDPLEIVITKDGQTETFSFANPATATNYTLTQSVASAAAAATAQVLATTLSATVLLHQPIEGRSIRVQARTGRTTAGTTSNLSARVKYARIP